MGKGPLKTAQPVRGECWNLGHVAWLLLGRFSHAASPKASRCQIRRPPLDRRWMLDVEWRHRQLWLWVPLFGLRLVLCSRAWAPCPASCWAWCWPLLLGLLEGIVQRGVDAAQMKNARWGAGRLGWWRVRAFAHRRPQCLWRQGCNPLASRAQESNPLCSNPPYSVFGRISSSRRLASASVVQR